MSLIKVFAKDPVIGALAQHATVLRRSKPLVQIASADNHEATLCFRSFSRNDVDYSIDCVGSPNGPSWAADHFDTFYILKRKIQDITEDATKSRRVDISAIDHDQKLIAEPPIQPPGGNCPGIGIDLRDVESGNHAQQAGNIGRPGPMNVCCSDDKDCGSGPGYLLFGLGYGSHFGVHQIFKAQVSQVGACGLRPNGKD